MWFIHHSCLLILRRLLLLIDDELCVIRCCFFWNVDVVVQVDVGQHVRVCGFKLFFLGSRLWCDDFYFVTARYVLVPRFIGRWRITLLFEEHRLSGHLLGIVVMVQVWPERRHLWKVLQRFWWMMNDQLTVGRFLSCIIIHSIIGWVVMLLWLISTQTFFWMLLCGRVSFRNELLTISIPSRLLLLLSFNNNFLKIVFIMSLHSHILFIWSMWNITWNLRFLGIERFEWRISHFRKSNLGLWFQFADEVGGERLAKVMAVAALGIRFG